jgi:hypothetical protein
MTLNKVENFVSVHRHIGGLEIAVIAFRLRVVVHRHIGGLEIE